ncbi:MAG: shikimate kinase [Synergistaceae bacterium]|nr:shikimate kinase [Synergistaceae bacterium]
MAEKSIFLGGFMCSGKTSVGKSLSARLGWTFIDTDDMIEERAGMSVGQIFQNLGEPAFRALEYSAVTDALKEEKHVVSLGGGALVNEQLRNMILSHARLVILDVRPETVLARAKRENRRRPLLENGNVPALMEKRRGAYALCHIRVATDEFSVSSVADRILTDLRKGLPSAARIGAENPKEHRPFRH